VIERVPDSGDYGHPASPWGAIDWTAHQRTTLIDGRRVHYVDIGEGPLGFVLVHGMGGCWAHWSQTLPLLARHGRALALDLPGFGRSQMPPAPISLELLADTAAALARRAGIEKVVLVGHSMGGPIALRFAQRHPHLAHALILLAGAIASFSQLLGLHRVIRSARRRPAHTAATFTEILTCPIPLPEALKRQIAEHPPLRRLALWPYLHRPAAMPAQGIAFILQGAGARGALQTARALGSSDPREGLGEVRCPILSVGTRHDRIAPVADFEAFAKLLPAQASVLIEGAGHLAMLERPLAFNALIERFLARHQELQRA
jgi:pimeloyl-ACP methyl ester carboxylesterase